ncbi:hypothetical protein KP509_15G050900 [Ceratopteris richardii]|nr:hypothetical protein KP509_15G050900 [Ceratopteris richardii]
MGQEGMARETLQLFHRMAEFECQPTLSTYHCVLSTLIKESYLDDVLKLCQEMEDANIEPDKLTLGMLTNALCKGHRLDEALRIAERVPQSIDALTLNGLARCLCKEMRPHDALRLVENIKAYDIFPDAITCHTVMCAFCKVGKLDVTMDLLKKASEESPAYGTAACNAVLDHLVKMARIDEAWHMFQELPADPDATSYNIIVKGLCMKRKIEKAQELVSEMAARAFTPSLETYAWIAKGLTRLGKAKKACDFLLDLRRKGIAIDSAAVNEIIDVMCSRKKEDVGRELLKEMNGHGYHPDACTYTAIINGFCKSNRSLAALDFVMEDVLVSGCVLDITDWSLLFKCLYDEGCLDEMVKLYDILLENKVVPNKATFNIIISSFSKAGRVHDVKRVLDDMYRNDIIPNTKTYEGLIDGDIEDISCKVELFEPLIGSDIVLTAEKYQLLIGGLIKSGEMAFAMRVLHEMKRNGCPPDKDTYNALVGGLCNTNMLSEAMEFIQIMKDNECTADAATYTMLLHGFWKAGQIDKLKSLYMEMKKNDISPDAATFNILLEVFSESKKAQEVLRLLDEMRLHGCPPNYSTLSSLHKKLGFREFKKVKNHVKELFGIVFMPEASEGKENEPDVKNFGLSFKQSASRTARKGKSSTKK